MFIMHVTCKRVKVYTFSPFLGSIVATSTFAVGSVITVDDSKFGESAGKYAPNLQNVYMYVDIFFVSAAI